MISQLKKILTDHRLWFWLILAGLLVKCQRNLAKFWGWTFTPDALSYLEIAEGMSHPYDTCHREPLWIWMVKASQVLSGGERDWIRLAGVGVFVLAAVVLYHLMRRITGKPLYGLLAFLAFASNQGRGDLPSGDNIIAFAYKGLRDSSVLFAILSFFFFLFTLRDSRRPGWSAAGLAVTAAAIVGTRLPMFTPVVVLLLVGVVAGLIHWRHLAISVVAMVVFMGPYLAYSSAKYGDPLYSANIHAVWWRNHEFVRMTDQGCVGCPTREELAGDSYAGSPTTVVKWIFGMHSLSHVVAQTATGFGRLFLEPNGSRFYYLSGTRGLGWWSLFLLGSFLTLMSRYRYALLFPFIMVNFLAFTVELEMPDRLFSPIAPFYSAMLAVGAGFIVQRTTRFLQEAGNVGHESRGNRQRG